tara:strand:- start:110 stop:610 length:501 start_codon:yes stop_codon:yes gene_type:complete
MLYFKLFPKIEYETETSTVSLVDITVRSKVLDYVRNNHHLTIDTYLIERDERPEEVSFEVYSTFDYTWSILALNKVYNIHLDWFRPQEVLDRQIIREYGSLENAQQTIVEAYDEYGYEVDKSDPNVRSRVSAFEKIVTENENKREVQVFSPDIISRIHADFESDLR